MSKKGDVVIIFRYTLKNLHPTRYYVWVGNMNINKEANSFIEVN